MLGIVWGGSSRLSGRAVGRIEIVDHVVMARLAVAVPEDRVWQAREVGVYRRNPGRRLIRAGHVSTPAEAIFLVPVVRAGLRIGILDHTGGRHRRLAAGGVEADIPGREREVIDRGPAKDRLVVVVRNGVPVSKRAEIGAIARGHIEKAHRHAALQRVILCEKGVGVARAQPHRFCSPHEQIHFSAIDLLPHLEEAVHRITGVCAVAHVLRDLEGSVRHRVGEAPVGNVLALAKGICGVGLRQQGVGAGLLRGGRKAAGDLGHVLLREPEVRAGRAVGAHDAPRQQVGDRLPGLRLVGCKQVIESAVLAHNDDQVLDRCARIRRPGIRGDQADRGRKYSSTQDHACSPSSTRAGRTGTLTSAVSGAKRCSSRRAVPSGGSVPCSI